MPQRYKYLNFVLRIEVRDGFRRVGADVSHINTEISQLKEAMAASGSSRKKGGRLKLAPVEEPHDADDDERDERHGSVGEGTGLTRSDKLHHNRLMVRLRVVSLPDALLTCAQECVRDHLKIKLGISDYAELYHKFPPLTDDEIERFARKAAGAPECSLQRFRIDFKHPWKKLAFNRQARFLFIESFRHAVQGGSYSVPPLPEVLLTKEQVRSVYQLRLRCSCHALGRYRAR